MWVAMSGQEFVGAAHWRCKEHVGVDRILSDSRVVFYECVCITGELCFPCYRDECVLCVVSRSIHQLCRIRLPTVTIQKKLLVFEPVAE